MTPNPILFSAFNGIKGAFLVDFHFPASFIGHNLTRDQLNTFYSFVEMLNVHVYIGGVETLADEEDLTSQFDRIMPSTGVPPQLMDSVFKYLRILLLSSNSVQVERAAILIGHIFLNYNDNLVNRYINNNRRFMKTLSIVARRQLCLDTDASLRAANRIFMMIRLWAETYKMLKKPNSFIWDTYIKLRNKHEIEFQDPDPVILKKTCLKVGRKTNMDSSSEIMKGLEAEIANDFENYKVFAWDHKEEVPESPSHTEDSQTVCSDAKDFTVSQTPREAPANAETTSAEDAPSDKPRSLMVMLGLSSPEAISKPAVQSTIAKQPSLGEMVSTELYRRPSIKTEPETPSTTQNKTLFNGHFPFGLSPFTSPLEKQSNPQNSQVLSQRSGKVLDADFSNVSIVRAKWQDIDAKEANKSFTSGGSGAVKRSNSSVRAE
jgi:hypothetical protein